MLDVQIRKTDNLVTVYIRPRTPEAATKVYPYGKSTIVGKFRNRVAVSKVVNANGWNVVRQWPTAV